MPGAIGSPGSAFLVGSSLRPAPGTSMLDAWMTGLAGWCLVTSAPSFGEVFGDRNKHFQCLEKFGDLQTSEILDF